MLNAYIYVRVCVIDYNYACVIIATLGAIQCEIELDYYCN